VILVPLRQIVERFSVGRQLIAKEFHIVELCDGLQRAAAALGVMASQGRDFRRTPSSVISTLAFSSAAIRSRMVATRGSA
jgi:hypothetical protein